MNVPQNVPTNETHSPDALVARHAQPGRTLLAVLHAIQDEAGCVPPAALAPLARALNLSRAEVYGVLTYYHDFRTRPPAAVTVRLCRAEACRSMGGEALARHIEARTGRRFDLSGAHDGADERNGRGQADGRANRQTINNQTNNQIDNPVSDQPRADAPASAPDASPPGADALALESAYCLGQCALSPALTINGELHAKLTPQKFDALLARTVRATHAAYADRSGEAA